MTTWQETGRLRLVGAAIGGLASVAIVAVGCSSVTQGTAQGNSSAAPEYRTSVQKSIDDSSSSSVSRESQKQVAEATEAVQTACGALLSGNNDSVDAVNAYIGASNQDSPDAETLIGPAVDALNNGADQVTSNLSDAVPAELSSALNGWADSARGLATALSTATNSDGVNAAIKELQSAKDAATAACRAAS